MLPFKVVYHDQYDLNLGAHVFPSQKFRLIAEALLAEKIASKEDFARPAAASDEDILRVHTPVWVAAGGSILAAQCALRDGFGTNLGGGFHHAYPDHGEGFCAIHDVAVAIRRLQADGAIKKAMVVDSDVCHGNGTAAIFRNDPPVFTSSL